MSAINLKNCEWEAMIQTSKSDSIMLNNKSIDTPTSNEITTIYSRVISQGRQGINVSNTKTSLNDSLNQAYKIARLTPKKELMPKISSANKFSIERMSYKDFDEKKIVESTEEIRSIIGDKAPILEFMIKKDRSDILYVNYLGARISLKTDALGMRIMLGKDDQIGSNISLLSGKKPSLKEFAERAIRQYNYSKILSRPTSGDYPVIFCNEALNTAMIPVLFSLKGDSVCEKKSRFTESLGKKELSKDLTIIDNSFEKNNRWYMDFEGNRAKKTVLVRNGVINSFLHDSYTSEKLGMKNTANSASMTLKPSVSYHCISIKGKDRLKDMIKSVKEGFIVYDLYPEHTVNTATGAFGQNSTTIYYIKNGEIQGLAKGYVVMGNSYEIFKKPLEVSKETRNDLAGELGAVKAKARILKN